jgi:hypothetical protein
MLLQSLEEVDILTANERDEDAKRALQTTPQQTITSTGDKASFLHAGRNILRVEVPH